MTQRFVKFLKYEMLTHQSEQNEPLCVLTSFQAFGHGEHEPYDDADDDPTDDRKDDDKNFVQKTVDIIRKTIFTEESAENAPNPDPESTKSPMVSTRRLGIRSYQTCWLASVTSR